MEDLQRWRIQVSRPSVEARVDHQRILAGLGIRDASPVSFSDRSDPETARLKWIVDALLALPHATELGVNR